MHIACSSLFSFSSDPLGHKVPNRVAHQNKWRRFLKTQIPGISPRSADSWHWAGADAVLNSQEDCDAQPSLRCRGTGWVQGHLGCHLLVPPLLFWAGDFQLPRASLAPPWSHTPSESGAFPSAWETSHPPAPLSHISAPTFSVLWEAPERRDEVCFTRNSTCWAFYLEGGREGLGWGGWRSRRRRSGF